MGRRLRFAVRSRQARWGRLLDAFGGATYSQHIAWSRRSSTEAPLTVGPRSRHRVACARRWGGWGVEQSGARSPTTEPRPLAEIAEGSGGDLDRPPAAPASRPS